MHSHWTARPETAADVDVVRDIVLAAFETPLEADLVDALRSDDAWIDGLSHVSAGPDGTPVGYALLTRCRIGEVPALCLAPVAVHPDQQRRGAGDAAIRSVLEAARRRGEEFVTVLGHPGYYPRFGFERAAAHGIGVPFDVPEEALMALALGSAPLPAGTIRYAGPFGI
ncbi:N-acetyltransferase [Streptomyces sp. NPDC000983]|uniref:GNAT family N-acetyltransferase n=1 Tax=Streptomyces sp. NPDC000983 TaxID=3154373 RepID=UPI003320560C